MGVNPALVTNPKRRAYTLSPDLVKGDIVHATEGEHLDEVELERKKKAQKAGVQPREGDRVDDAQLREHLNHRDQDAPATRHAAC